MNATSSRLARGLAGTGLLAALAAAGAGPDGIPARTAIASVPAGMPTFGAPLDIDHPYLPFRAGGVNVYRGTEGRARITVVEQQLPEIRDFDWQGVPVSCRIVRESKFKNGAATEISRSYFAQADDGSVWYFGEIAEPIPVVPDEEPDEPADSESNGWVVGAVGPDDPPDTASAPGPFLFLPANPEVGDLWKPEDLFPVVDETDVVVRSGVTLRVPAGRFRNCIVIRETTLLDPGSETKWYAPGVGLVQERGRREGLVLQATTLRRR